MKGVSLWLWISFSVIVGVLFLFMLSSFSESIQKEQINEKSISEFNNLYNELQIACHSEQGYMKIVDYSIYPNVISIYTCYDDCEDREDILDLIEYRNSAEGSNICINLTDKKICRQLDCNVKLTFMGFLPPERDPFIRMKENLEGEEREDYTIFIRKIDYGRVSACSCRKEDKECDMATCKPRPMPPKPKPPKPYECRNVNFWFEPKPIVKTRGWDGMPKIDIYKENPVVCWMNVNKFMNNKIKEANILCSFFDGWKWSKPEKIIETNGLGFDMKSDNNIIHIISSTENGLEYIYFDGSWSNKETITRNKVMWPSIRIDGNNIYAVWQEGTFFNKKTYFSKRTNNGWITPVELGGFSEPTFSRNSNELIALNITSVSKGGSIVYMNYSNTWSTPVKISSSNKCFYPLSMENSTVLFLDYSSKPWKGVISTNHDGNWHEEIIPFGGQLISFITDECGIIHIISEIPYKENEYGNGINHLYGNVEKKIAAKPVIYGVYPLSFVSDETGSIHLVWSQYISNGGFRNQNTDIYYTKYCQVCGCSCEWTEPEPFSDLKSLKNIEWIEINNNKIHLLYRDGDEIKYNGPWNIQNIDTNSQVAKLRIFNDHGYLIRVKGDNLTYVKLNPNGIENEINVFSDVSTGDIYEEDGTLEVLFVRKTNKTISISTKIGNDWSSPKLIYKGTSISSPLFIDKDAIIWIDDGKAFLSVKITTWSDPIEICSAKEIGGYKDKCGVMHIICLGNEMNHIEVINNKIINKEKLSGTMCSSADCSKLFVLNKKIFFGVGSDKSTFTSVCKK